jgi:hypothetical protein
LARQYGTQRDPGLHLLLHCKHLLLLHLKLRKPCHALLLLQRHLLLLQHGLLLFGCGALLLLLLLGASM